MSLVSFKPAFFYPLHLLKRNVAVAYAAGQGFKFRPWNLLPWWCFSFLNSVPW